MGKLLRDPLYIRNVVFGVEDSLVSTVGLLSGIATEQATHTVILSTGVIYLSVEALSMAVGSFLSEESAEEAEGGDGGFGRAAFGGAVMLVSFAVAGFVPILPYLFAEGATALASSIVLSLVLLFALGFIPTRSRKTSRISRGARMAILGGIAIVVGVVVGSFFGVR